MVNPALILAVMLSAAPSGKGEYRRATKLYSAARYEAALPHFQRAYEQSEHRPSTTFGLAQCERMLGMYEQAESHLEEFLRTAPVRGRARGRKLLVKVRAALRDPEPPVEIEVPPPLQAVLPRPLPPAAEPRPRPELVQTKVQSATILDEPVFWAVSAAVVVASAVGAGLLLSRGSPTPSGGSSGQVFEP